MEWTTDDDDAIRVLLVDDNEQWVQFLGDDLERVDPTLEVSTALSGVEAMMTLEQADADIDCVVADYRMPGVDGLELLDRVRALRSQLPFLLVTAAGSEEVAAAAIDRGVTDYLVKRTDTDQTQLYARRIRAAYEQYRLRFALEESEERYRTVTERTREGIVIVQDGEIVFSNQRAGELTGRSPEELVGMEAHEELFLADEDTELEALLAGQLPGSTRLVEARVEGPEGIHDCEVAWAEISHGGRPAVLLSLRDVTARRRRERSLHLERRLDRRVLERLVESPTRTELETVVLEGLREQGYALVTAGDATEPTAIPRGSAYLDTLAASSGLEGEPGVVADRTGDPAIVGDVRDLPASGWRAAALDAGFRSVAAFPVSHGSVRFGVLRVCHPDPGAVEGIQAETLEHVADTLAFALHHIDTERGLGTATGVDVTFKLEGGDYLQEVLGDPDFDTANVRADVQGTHAGKGGAAIQYVEVSGVELEQFLASARNHSLVRRGELLTGRDPPCIQLEVTEPPPTLQLMRQGGKIHTHIARPDRTRIGFRLPERGDVRSLAEELEPNGGTVTVEEVREQSAGGRDGGGTRLDLSSLTEKQSAALAAAVQHGYFDQPRTASATEIAASLDVAHSTFLQHLRAAQRKVFEGLFRQSDEGMVTSAP